MAAFRRVSGAKEATVYRSSFLSHTACCPTSHKIQALEDGSLIRSYILANFAIISRFPDDTLVALLCIGIKDLRTMIAVPAVISAFFVSENVHLLHLVYGTYLNHGL